jgi:hypothetical protein
MMEALVTLFLLLDSPLHLVIPPPGVFHFPFASKKKFLCTSKLKKSRFKTHIVFLPVLAAVHRRYVRMRDVFFYYICDLAAKTAG